MLKRKLAAGLAILSMVSMISACSPSSSTAATSSGASSSETSKAKTDDKNQKNLTGNITIDGSSTVLPLSSAIAEEFTKENKGVKVPVSGSGSGTGLKKLINGDIFLADSSRKIKDEEIKTAKEKGIEIVEIKVAIDGIAVVVNKDNKVDAVTTAELNKAWGKDSTAKTWKDINSAWEASPLKLFSPGAASGTFEYFTEHVNKKAKEQRVDGVQTSEDDNVLVTGVTGDKGAMGYFGFSYFEENMGKLKALKIDGVEPTMETIVSGKYPLSRPLFIYVNKKQLESDPAMKAFVKFYLENAKEMTKDVKMIAQPDDVYNKQLEDLKLK